MISTILNLLLFIFILGILVFVHEFGHFITAKKSHVHIYEFSIGMGPAIKTIKGKDGINYSIRALPIGGYVQMAGEMYEDDDSGDVASENFLCNRPWYQRLIVLCAGVFNNFLLAIILIFTMALIWGSPSTKPVIYDVGKDTPAEQAGLKAGDTITAINGSKVKSWEKTQLLLLVKDKDGAYDISVTHKNGDKETVSVTPEKKDGNNVFGIAVNPESKKGFGRSIKYAFAKFGGIVDQMWLTLKYLFTGGISVNSLSGPVGIYSVVGESRSAGIQSVLSLIAYLSINLGVMNILPIPALDGGHVLFLIIEKIRRKKMNEKIEGIATTIFFGLLLLLMAYITIHDIIRLLF